MTAQDWFSANAPKPARAEVTALSPAEETQFRQWVQREGITDVDHEASRYDYRGYWKDVASKGGDQRKAYADGPHFPDTYKQHGHPTFSVESKYSTGPSDGGRWEGETYVPQATDWFASNAAPVESPQPAAPAGERSIIGRVFSGAKNAVVEGVTGAMDLVNPVPRIVRGAMDGGLPGAVEAAAAPVKGALQAQFDQYKAAKKAEREGRTSEMVGHSVAAAVPGVGPMAARWGEMIGGGEAPEAVGEMIVGAAAPLVGKVASKAVPAVQNAMKARAAAKTARAADASYRAVEMAIPPTKTTPYTKADWDVAKPYLDAEHAKAPITSTPALRDALDTAVAQIENDISGVIAQFPIAKLQPPVVPEVMAQLGKHPRREFMTAGLKELDDLPVGAPMSLTEADALRKQLNAENKAILKKNSYDVATARKVDPGFAAREVAANVIRDTLYDFLESNNVGPIRQLRREEGSLIKLRNAAEAKAMAGQRPVAGSAESGPLRRVAAELMEKGSTATGAAVGGPVGAVVGAQVGETLGTAVRGSRRTRDDLITRAFRR